MSKSTSWRKNVHHTIKTYIITSKSTSWYWINCMPCTIIANKKLLLLSKSKSWRQKAHELFMVSKISHDVKNRGTAWHYPGDITNYPMTLQSTSWWEEVQRDVTKFVMTCHNHTIFLRNNLGFCQVCLEITAEVIFDNQLRQLSCRSLLSNKPEAVISRTILAKSPDCSCYNILGQLCKHVLSQLIKGIAE